MIAQNLKDMLAIIELAGCDNIKPITRGKNYLFTSKHGYDLEVECIAGKSYRITERQSKPGSKT